MRSLHEHLRRAITITVALLIGVSLGAGVGPGAARAATSAPLAIGQATSGDLNVLAVDATAAGTQVKIRRYVVGVGAAVNNQRWTFETITGSGIPAQTYRIRNVAAGLCMERAASSANNAAVTIAACRASTDQYWSVQQSTSGLAGRDIRSVRDSRCLDIAGNSVDGIPAVMWQCTTVYPTQKWKIRYGAFDCPERAVTTLCANPSQPIFGVFAGARQWTVDVRGGTDVDYNDFQNFLSFESLNDQGSNEEYDLFEMGWSAVYDSGTVSHDAYWSETGVRDGWVVLERHSLAGVQHGAEALGRNYSFMALPNDNGTWDILYNYNPVGTSQFGEGPRVAAGLETGAIARYSEYVTLANAFENHVQLLTGNDVWRRPYLAETSTMQYNTCNDPEFTAGYLESNTPPWCWTATTGTRPGAANGPLEADYFTVGKPATVVAHQPVPSAPTGPARVVNGVDQRKLAQCMADGANCLNDVPGLAACVAARKTCNDTSVPQPPRSASGTRLETSSDAAASARRALSLPEGAAVRTRSMTAKEYAAVTGQQPLGVTDTDLLEVAYGDQTVDRLSGKQVGPFPGFVLAYHHDSGRLLHACLGQTCQKP